MCNEKSYRELIQLKTLEERFEYLSHKNRIGDATFGSHRWLNQVLYSSWEWKQFRHEIIIRDNACDLAMPGYDIAGGIIIIHHINFLTVEDVLNRSRKIFDPNNVVCASERTHKAIHYGNKDLLPVMPIERRPGDTLCWK